MSSVAPASSVRLSKFAQGLSTETAFDVLAVARKLKAQGKDVIELQIGDSPFASTKSALKSGIDAINANQTHYCASLGLPGFREAVAANYRKEYGIDISADNVVVGAYVRAGDGDRRQANCRSESPLQARGLPPRVPRGYRCTFLAGSAFLGATVCRAPPSWPRTECAVPTLRSRRSCWGCRAAPSP